MNGPMYYRSLPADLEVDEDAGTAEGILVPWDQETPIVERRGDALIRYTEVFRSGSCERAIRAPGRLPITYGHSDSFSDRLGVATVLEDRKGEGLWGKFRFDPSKVDAARDAVTTSHRALSIAFLSVVPKAFSERDGTLVERRSTILQHVAAVPEGAYEGAQLLVVRNLTDDDEETAADVAAREELQRQAAVLAEAEELIAAGARWAHLRR